MKRLIFLYSLFLCGITAWSQPTYLFQPDATDAVHKDSSIIVAWATGCTVKRGYINIEDTTQSFTQGGTTSNRAFFGNASNATGYPESNMNVVSLGDGGSAILTFEKPITNGQGKDFAVFENGFLSSEPPFNYYLELAFVEVSSDGEHFVRFPASSHIQDSIQIGTYGQMNPDDIYNLAGKYPVDYGTPFDLSDLKDSAGINTDSIVYVKIVDVVGDINPAFASYDAEGNIINDPWPTPFWTGGFDLNGVGVIHEAPTLVQNREKKGEILMWPVPARDVLHLKVPKGKRIYKLTVTSTDGRVVYRSNKMDFEHITLPLTGIASGLYFVTATTGEGTVTRCVVINAY